MTRSISRHTTVAAFVLLTALSLLSVSASAATTTFSFPQNLQLWHRGAEVQTLQQFLNEQGFLVAESGPGSPGEETSVFGLLTYHALIRYQQVHDLPATGYFGPLTRSAASQSSAGTSSGAAGTNANTLPQSNQTPSSQGTGTNSSLLTSVSPPSR